MIREDLKIPLTMLSISYLNKLNFKGSYNGKRFMFEKNGDKLKVYVWDDLYCFENTDEKDIKSMTYTYDKAGINEGLDFVEAECSKH